MTEPPRNEAPAPEEKEDDEVPVAGDAGHQFLPPAGPPFGPAFFAMVLTERVRAACDGQPDHVPVVELQLADGLTLDLCHIPGVQAQWLAVQAYRDRETCQEMDLVFVPYGLITRVTVSMWQPSQRPIGFQLTPPATEPAP